MKTLKRTKCQDETLVSPGLKSERKSCFRQGKRVRNYSDFTKQFTEHKSWKYLIRTELTTGTEWIDFVASSRIGKTISSRSPFVKIYRWTVSLECSMLSSVRTIAHWRSNICRWLVLPTLYMWKALHADGVLYKNHFTGRKPRCNILVRSPCTIIYLQCQWRFRYVLKKKLTTRDDGESFRRYLNVNNSLDS